MLSHRIASFLNNGLQAAFPYFNYNLANDVYSFVRDSSSRYAYGRLIIPGIFLAADPLCSQCMLNVGLGSICMLRSWTLP